MTQKRPGALEKRLSATSACRRVAVFRSTAAGVFAIGELGGLLRWLAAREAQALNRGCEIEEAAAISELAWQQTARDKKLILRRWEKEAREHARHAEARQAKVRASLLQRETQRRQADPYAHVKAALGRSSTVVRVAPPRVVPSPSPPPPQPSPPPSPPPPLVYSLPVASEPDRSRGRHHGSRPIGECGQKLSRRIDQILQSIREEDAETTTPPHTEQPVIQQTTEQVTEQGTEQETEQTFPVVLPQAEGDSGAHAEGGAPQGEEGSAWDALAAAYPKTAPRLELLLRLQQALRSTPQGGTVCLQATDAIALTELLLSALPNEPQPRARSLKANGWQVY